MYIQWLNWRRNLTTKDEILGFLRAVRNETILGTVGNQFFIPYPCGRGISEWCVRIVMFYAVLCIIPLFWIHFTYTPSLPDMCHSLTWTYICILGGIFCDSIFQSGFHHPMEGMEDLVAEYRESLIEKARSIDWGLGLGSSWLHLKPGAF